MSYEIDFVSVKKDICSKNADAIAIRWNAGTDDNPELLSKYLKDDDPITLYPELSSPHIYKYPKKVRKMPGSQ